MPRGSFPPRELTSAGTAALQRAQDGLADIVHVSEDDSRSIRTYRALGNGTFSRTAIVTRGINNTGVGAAVFAGLGREQGFLVDVTGDQNPDYVFTTDLGLNGILVWPGNDAGGFSTGAPITTTGLTGLADDGLQRRERVSRLHGDPSPFPCIQRTSHAMTSRWSLASKP